MREKERRGDGTERRREKKRREKGRKVSFMVTGMMETGCNVWGRGKKGPGNGRTEPFLDDEGVRRSGRRGEGGNRGRGGVVEEGRML